MRIVKKVLKWIGLTILTLFIIGNLVILISGRWYIYKALGATYFRGHIRPTIYDLDVFDYRKVPTANPQPWHEHQTLGKLKLNDADRKRIEELDPAGFLVLWGDSLIFEEYWNNHGENKISNSFSMAKSIVSLLVGVAIDEGKIKSIDDPVADYLSEFTDAKKNITIRHILTMSSGLSWSESYNHPFCDVAELYYDSDDRDLALNRRTIEEDPGEIFRYKSGDTQVLVYVLKAATGKSVSEYASEKLWQKMGAESEAKWSLAGDASSTEKGFCCFYARSRDFLRLGRLINNRGNWKGEQLVSKSYVDELCTLAPLKKSGGEANNCYGYQYWIYTGEKYEVTYLRGMNGQYIISIPEKDLVIVRTGSSVDDKWKNTVTETNDALQGHRKELPDYIHIGVDLLNQVQKMP
ncbi:serine hydrolase [Crocinitomix catalasitica]|nr:serine hydrolase [Crocinitomix catalasitica]